MRKIHVRAAVAALVLLFVFTLHALQPDGQNLNRPSGRGNSAPVAHQQRSFTPPTKSFVIGKEPRGIAFDGDDLWVANRDDNNVIELRASDGVVVRTVAVRGAPDGVIFDGANIWVVNQGYNLKVDGSVTKLNPANGATLGIFPVGHHPSTATFDGANIWVASFQRQRCNQAPCQRWRRSRNLHDFPLCQLSTGKIFGWQTMAAVPPNAGLIVDDSGNLYGTTTKGGDRDYNGTVFRLGTIGGMFTVLFKFGGTRTPTRMQPCSRSRGESLRYHRGRKRPLQWGCVQAQS
jgi:uncharacterized repeat protein (TIGR03803 family)